MGFGIEWVLWDFGNIVLRFWLQQCNFRLGKDNF